MVGVNREKRQIDLSVKAALPAPESENVIDDVQDSDEEPVEELTAMAAALQKAMEGSKEDKDSNKKDKAGSADEQTEIIRRTLERHKDEA